MKKAFFVYEALICFILFGVIIRIYRWIFLNGPVSHSDLLLAMFLPAVISVQLGAYLGKRLVFKCKYNIWIALVSFTMQIVTIPFYIVFYLDQGKGDLISVQYIVALVGYICYNIIYYAYYKAVDKNK